MIGRRRFGLGAAALAISTGAQAQSAKTVLRVVPQAEPQVFDPHQSGVNATQEHAALVYDTLFSWDADMVARPQMVEAWNKSDDGLLYSFTLRPGLKFHDLTPVTSRDVVATLRRLLVRDTQNQILASLVAELQAKDDRTFTLRLKEPFHYVEFLLCGSNGVMGGIMREKDALTDPFTPVKARIGSGPFRFVENEYQPGNKLVYETVCRIRPARRTRQRLRRRQARFGRSRRVDDHAGRCGCLCGAAPGRGGFPRCAAVGPAAHRGERQRHRHRRRMADRDLCRAALQFAVAAIRQCEGAPGRCACGEPARLHVGRIRRPEILARVLRVLDLRQSERHRGGSEDYRKPDLDKARTLVRKSGYDGRPVVLIGGSDVLPYQRMSLITADLLKQIGMNVDMQLSDWGSVAARRAKKDAPSKGGWNLFHTSANGAQLASPLTSPSTITTCDGKNFPGWPCDQVEEDMRMQYIRETDAAKQKALLDAMHRQLWQSLPYVPLGQFRQPFLWRSNVKGVLKANTVVYWNIAKT